MKKLLKIICSTAIVTAAVTLFTACGNWNTPYDTLDKDGYTVSVRFDANGGMFAGTNDVYVVDVFHADDQNIRLLEPNDAKRGKDAFEIARSQYQLAGWYRTRELRTNEAGEALDDYGNLCSESGLSQGYIYSGKWDFEKDRLNTDNSKATSSEDTLVLYAAWIPYVNYEFYSFNPQTQQYEQFGSTYLAIDLSLPTWNEKTGKLNYGNFPTVSGMTFDKAYLDAEKTQQITADLVANVDEARGILDQDKTVKIYTEWLDGEWFHIYDAKQFYDNAKLDGNYVLHADLDFSKAIWKSNLTEKEFTGSIIGNGHKISNINATQTASVQDRQEYGGLFGVIGSTAEIRDVTFENVSYTVKAGTRAPEAYFGLLAGNIAEGAVLENIQISGTLKLSDERYQTKYNFGLLYGMGVYGDIDVSGITCVEIKSADGTETPIAADPVTGVVTVPASQSQAS